MSGKKVKRGDEIPRPKPWTVRAANSQAAEGWTHLSRHALENLDRAWVAITSDPRRTDDRQYRLSGSLGSVKYSTADLEQWQYKVTGSGRIWYAIDDADRTLWVTQAGTGHPKATER